MKTSENFIPSDDAIRSFLLGRLEADEQEQFEAQLMIDDLLHERVRRAEFHLADDFVSERIDRIDRQRVLKIFMLTDDRRQMVSVSDALYRRFAPERQVSLISGFPRSVFNRPVLRFAFGALVLLLLIGSVWLVTKQPQRVRNLIPKPMRPHPAATPTPQEANHPSDTAPPAHREPNSSPPEHESSLPTEAPGTRVVTLALSPGVVADVAQMPTITLPQGDAGVVRLELTGAQNLSGAFQFEVLTSANLVFAGSVTKEVGARLNVEVPAKMLKAGDYEVRLSRLQDGSKQVVSTYYFRVR